MSDLDDFRADKDAFFRDDPRSPLTDEQRARFSGLSYFPETPELDQIDPFQSATVTCPAGKNVVGTGAQINHADSGSVGYVVLDGIFPDPGLTSVTAQAVESTSTDSFWTVTAFAICAYP